MKLKERFNQLDLQAKNISAFMGFAARKPVFGVSDKVRFKPACSATETS